MPKKNIIIYGATGSIGDSTLELIRNNLDDFNIIGLTCNNNIEKLKLLAAEFNCKNIGIADTDSINKYRNTLINFELYEGINEFHNMITEQAVDIIIFAIAGSDALNLSLNLAESGKVLGLANKECIVCAGKLFMDKIKSSSTKLIPLDSEHNAIYQLCYGKNTSSINNYIITASGGHFYNYTETELRKITPQKAVTHPQWSMGEKISVDSSTLMNKGLEIIEACNLFDFNEDKIDALIHPESIIHGIINFKDNSSHAFLSAPNMQISISSILFPNNDVRSNNFDLDLKKISTLNFYEIDELKFRAINLAKSALKHGGLMPSVLNYSNELMVNQFIEYKICFTEIVINSEIVMEKFLSDGNNILNPTISNIFESFGIVKDYIDNANIFKIFSR
jgi:1-deoxy-D-xylulose-5-phosphate reductoisomerase|tara:strand:+ start:11349 stop:12527 length:1179 start_codon:yes stop_codon:yes gene_type:complete